MYNIMSTQRTVRSKGSAPSKELESLRTQVARLEETNAILELRNEKAAGAEEKIEMVLRQNNQLTIENQKLSRMLQSQKAETEVMRQKGENVEQLHQRWEEERQELEDEIDQLKLRLSEAEKFKSNQINEQKIQSKLEIEIYRKQFSTNEESYSREMRRLRDQLSRKDQEIEQSEARVNKVTTEWQCDMIRWKEEKEKLKNALNHSQTDRVKELKSLRTRLENNYSEEIEALKRLHITNLQQAQMEAARLRERIAQLQNELFLLNCKHTKQRSEHDDIIAVFRRDIESYQMRLGEAEVFRKEELSDMSSKMTTYYNDLIDQLKTKHELSERKMLEEAERIQKYLRAKIGDAEEQLQRKATQKKDLEQQMYLLKAQRSEWEFRCTQTEDNHRIDKEEAAQIIADKSKQITYLERLIEQQKNFNQQEANQLSDLIRELEKKLAEQTTKAKEKEEQLLSKVAEVQKDLAKVQDENDEAAKDYARQIYELKNDLEGTSSHLNNQTETMAERNKSMQKDIVTLKESLDRKDGEIRAMIERLHEAAERETKLQNQVEDIRNKLLVRQENSVNNFRELQVRLENTYQHSLQNIKQEGARALQDQQNKCSGLQSDLKRKGDELVSLLKRYQRLAQQFETLTKQQAGKKGLTLKYPGANADILASKNIFDVYLKKRVLQECGSALNQRQPEHS